MIQLHPPLSGMPLAFVSLLVILESLRGVPGVSRRLPQIRPLLVLVIVVSSILSFVSGYQASSDLGTLPPVLENELGTHHAVGRFLLINSLLLGTFAWVRGIARRGAAVWSLAYYLFLLGQCVLTVWVGLLGGRLVFEHGFGVKPAQQVGEALATPTG